MKIHEGKGCYLFSKRWDRFIDLHVNFEDYRYPKTGTLANSENPDEMQ